MSSPPSRRCRRSSCSTSRRSGCTHRSTSSGRSTKPAPSSVQPPPLTVQSQPNSRSPQHSSLIARTSSISSTRNSSGCVHGASRRMRPSEPCDISSAFSFIDLPNVRRSSHARAKPLSSQTPSTRSSTSVSRSMPRGERVVRSATRAHERVSSGGQCTYSSRSRPIVRIACNAVSRSVSRPSRYASVTP